MMNWRSTLRFSSKQQQQITTSITSQLKEKKEFGNPIISLSSYSTSQLSYSDLFYDIDKQISKLSKKQKKKMKFEQK